MLKKNSYVPIMPALSVEGLSRSFTSDGLIDRTQPLHSVSTDSTLQHTG